MTEMHLRQPGHIVLEEHVQKANKEYKKLKKK